MITDARCASHQTRAHGPISYSPQHKSIVEIGFEKSASNYHEYMKKNWGLPLRPVV